MDSKMQFIMGFYASRITLLGVATIFALLVLNYYFNTKRALRKIPGPFYAPFTNLPLKYAVITGQRTAFIHKLHMRFGPFVRISPDEISIVDPESTKAIHRPGSGYWKSEWYARFIEKPVPTMFAMADPKQHSNRRKLFARAFTKSEIRMKWEPMVKATVELALDKINHELATGQVDVLKWLLFMATDVSSHLMFGEPFRALENGEVNHYFRILQTAAKGGAIADELPLIAFFGRRIPHPSFQELFRSNEYLSLFGEQLVMNGLKQGKGGVSIFTQLETSEEPQFDEKGSLGLTPLDLSTEAGNFILAGTDTSAFTLTCLIWSVLRQPSIQSALEEEVAGLDNSCSDAELETLPFLNAVINETLRLYGPASASLPRTVPQGGAQLGSYFIPENTTVSTQAWTLHRNEQIWPDPEKFDPNRWLNGAAQDASRIAFMPFGAGSRTCIGIHLAMMTLRFATALFFRRFKGAKPAPDCSTTLEFDNYFLLKPKGRWTIVAA